MKEAEASVASHSPSYRVAVTWHQKLGHMSEQGMKILVERKLLPGLTKQAPVLSLEGAKYFVSFIDDYSRRCWVYLIKKSDVFEVFKVYKAQVELDSGKKIKTRHCTCSGIVSRYMAEPGREHWEAVKRILRYIKGTSDVALCFGDSGLIVTGYVDSDYAVVAMSTTEAEYVATAQASKEAIWLKMLLEELGHKQEKITLFCDNQSALYLARNPAFHSKTKHIRVQYHFVREKVEEGTVDMQKIHTDDNVADYLTKAINCDKFIWCRSSCGLAET
ncbi:retrovirus-related pol polyprotein from transposon TNT 1-94 [Tanacetum coccineum]